MFQHPDRLSKNTHPPEERRRTARVPFTASAEVIEVSSGTHFTGRTSDLGRGGCFINTLNQFPEGSVVNLLIQKENELFEGEATVTYSQPHLGMGLEFTRVEAEKLWIIEKWVSEHTGEMKTETKGNEVRKSGAQSIDRGARDALREL